MGEIFQKLYYYGEQGMDCWRALKAVEANDVVLADLENRIYASEMCSCS